MTYDQAVKSGKTVYWEESTETIRLVPENYCIAARHKGRWITDIDGALKAYLGPIQSTINLYKDGSTGQAIADAIAEVVFPNRVSQ